MCETHQIPSSLIFPFALSALPDLVVGGVHDGDQYVDHQDAHDDLVDQPDGDASTVGELKGEIFVAARIFHMNCFGIVSVQHSPDRGDNEAPSGPEGLFTIHLHQGVVGCAVLLTGILERLEQGPGTHGMGAPDDQVDEGNPIDVLGHSVDADDDLAQGFNEDEPSYYPKQKKVNFDDERKYGT